MENKDKGKRENVVLQVQNVRLGTGTKWAAKKDKEKQDGKTGS